MPVVPTLTSTLLRSYLPAIKASKKVQAAGQPIMDPLRRSISSPSPREVYLRSDGGYSDFPPARVRESTPDQLSPPPPTRELPLVTVSSVVQCSRGL